MLSLDLINFRKSGARVQKLLPDKEEEECVFSVPKNGVSEYILAFGNTAELAERGSRVCC